MISSNPNDQVDDNHYLKSGNIEYRKYQVEIARKCVSANSLVVLPTGLGKTIIAVLVAAYTLERFPKGSKVIILAPTRPLINQHYEMFKQLLTISEDDEQESELIYQYPAFKIQFDKNAFTLKLTPPVIVPLDITMSVSVSLDFSASIVPGY